MGKFFDFVKNNESFMVGITGLVISWLVYNHSKRVQKDRWIDHFGEIHSAFWEDPDMRTVRMWLASDDAYNRDLRSLLRKRMRERAGKNEYEKIDQLDRFLNVMIRLLYLHPPGSKDELSSQRDYLLFSYWLKEATSGADRPELRWYVWKFYPKLIAVADEKFDHRPFPGENEGCFVPMDDETSI